MSSGKAVNQSKAKHCGAANEVAREGHTGRPSSCHSLLLKETVKACVETHAFHCPRSNSGEPASPLFKPKSQTQYEPVAHPGLCKSGLLIMAESSRTCLKKESKRNYVGSERLTPEKSFALMALRGLASAHWEDEHRRLERLTVSVMMNGPGPSQDAETNPPALLKTYNPPNTCPSSDACKIHPRLLR